MKVWMDTNFHLFFLWMFGSLICKSGCWFTEAYDPLDPNGNITIKWDVMGWNPDGYIVSLHNFLNCDKVLGKTLNTL